MARQPLTRTPSNPTATGIEQSLELRFRSEAKEAQRRFAKSEEVYQILRIFSGITGHGKGFDWDHSTLGSISDQPWYPYTFSPLLQPQQIFTLYKVACQKSYDHGDKLVARSHGKHHHACDVTPAEKKAAGILRSLGPFIRFQLRVFSPRHKQQRPYPEKPIFGPYVPDMIVYGLKPARPGKRGKKFQGVIIEIDGPVHDLKGTKDAEYEAWANQHGLYVDRYKNHEVHDLKRLFARKLKRKGYKLDGRAKSLPLNHQVRLQVMLRSIACWLSRSEIAQHLRDVHQFGVDPFALARKFAKLRSVADARKVTEAAVERSARTRLPKKRQERIGSEPPTKPKVILRRKSR